MGRALVVEADGGSRGNPGVAGYGALVRDVATGAVLAQRAEPLGRVSNNVAEYTGLIAGLQAAAEVDPGGTVEVRMDSKLVVEQMSGRWKIKHEDMRRLALRARDLAAGIGRSGGAVRYTWIPRAQNGAADRLSNIAMDGRTVRIGPQGDADGAGSGTPVATRPAVARATETAPAAASPEPATSAPHSRPAAAEPVSLFDCEDAEPPIGRAVGAAAPSGAEAQELAGRVLSPDPATLDAPVRLILVRHGVTDYTDQGRLDGRGGADPSLNQRGQAQAQAAAAGVRDLLARLGRAGPDEPVSIVTSSLRRARQTGGAVSDLLGVDPQVDPDWDEQSFGAHDGAQLADLLRTDAELLRRLREDDVLRWPNGESHQDLQERVGAALGRAVALGGTVVIATHRTPVAAVLAGVLGMPANRIWSLAISPASLSMLDLWPDARSQVWFVNDTHHLSPELREQPARPLVATGTR